MNPRNNITWIMLTIGSIMLAISFIYMSSISAFIGLGLIFWGALLLYIVDEKSVRTTMLISTTLPSLVNFNQLLKELKYKGEEIYLPPKYLTDLESSKIFISKDEETKLPSPKKIQMQEEKMFLENPQAILINPPGILLSKFFEKTLRTNFSKVDMNYLQDNLPSLFIDDLEIAENFEIHVLKKFENTSNLKTRNSTYDKIHVKITSQTYSQLCEKITQLSYATKTAGCPISSAIACAITKATGYPLVIDRIEVNGKTIVIDFRFLEAIEDEIKIAVEPIKSRQIKPSQKIINPNISMYNIAIFVSLFLAFTLLVMVGWVIWVDLSIYNKTLIQILFSSREFEAISLGIGLRIIHYLLVGIALLLLGIFIQFRKIRG